MLCTVLTVNLIMLFVVCIPTTLSHSNTTREYEFTKTFHDKCDSYPFVLQYQKLLEKPSDKYVVFVFSENGQNKGGLGDRLGGMMTGIAIALRFNRTFLIESNNGFDRYFTPYYDDRRSIFSGKKRTDFSYNKKSWTSWTTYNSSLSNNDATEYDLWNCINNPKTDSLCGMDYGDVPQPIIKLRSNRAYVCKWAKNRNIIANTELAKLGITTDGDNDNLWTAAGCLLRLAMWPTEAMWMQVNSYYNTMTSNDSVNKTMVLSHVEQEEYIKSINSYSVSQVGVHFRCGDVSYLHGDAASDYCVSSSVGNADYLRKHGKPIELGLCAHSLYYNFTIRNSMHELDDITRAYHKHNRIVLFVTSDSEYSSNEIKQFSNFPVTLTNPGSCHIQINSEEECSTATLTNWIVLSLSHVIITQWDNGPTSGFSRSASIYSLHDNSLRDPKNCHVPIKNQLISTVQQGNWFC